MNSYTELLITSLREIDEYSKSENGSQWDAASYTLLKDLVAQAAAEKDPGRVEDLLDMIMWCIVDPDRVGRNFAPSPPSIEKAQEIKIKIRRQREIDRNKRT